MRPPLRPYQEHGVQWLRDRHGGLLGDPMGLGKTRQILEAAAGLAPQAPPLLVVCPSMVMRVWAQEIQKWLPDAWDTITMMKPGEHVRWPTPGEVVITSYVGVRYWAKNLPPLPPRGVVITFDEAHRAKSKASQQGKGSAVLARLVRRAGGWTWPTTGTPVESKPTELWTLLCLAGVEREVFPKGWLQFVYDMGGSPAPWGRGYVWWGKRAADIGDRLSKVMLRRSRESVLPDLPPISYERILVTPPAGLPAVAALQRELAAAGLSPEDLVDANRTARSGKKVPFEAISKARKELALSKIPAVIQLAEAYEEAEEHLIAWSVHRAPIDALGARAGWGKLAGGMSQDQRDDVMNTASDLKGIAAMIQVAGVGISLTHASHQVVIDRAWNPGANQQAIDRLHRPGQTRPVRVIDLVIDHPLEIAVYELLREKEKLQEEIVTAAEVPPPPRVQGKLFGGGE